MVCQAGNLPDCMSLARLMEGGFKVAKIGTETVYLGAAAVGGLRSAICDFRSHRIGNWLRGSASLAPQPDLNVQNFQTFRLPYGIAIGAGTAMALLSALVSQ